MEDNSIPVRAYLDGKVIGEFDSYSKAARGLFIRNVSTIIRYFNGNTDCTFKGKRKGVKSYKTGLRYHFEKII